jgi:hypothetical protein
MSARDEQYGGKHYKEMKVQPWDIIATWPQAQQIGFYRGNALKYVMRAGSKDNPLQEIQKARHYLDRLIELLGDENDSRVVTISGVAAGARQAFTDESGREQDGSGSSGSERSA